MKNKEILYAPHVLPYTVMGRDEIKISVNGSHDLMDKLFSIMSQMKPYYKNGARDVFFCIDRGPIEAFGDYKEMKAFGEVKNRKEFEKLWLDYYPYEKIWFNFGTIEEDGYRGIFLNNRLIMEVNPHAWREEDTCDEKQFADFLNFAIKKMQECIEMLKAGAYNDFVNENLHFEFKTGTVLRSDFWKVFPNVKNHDFECITDSDREDFIEKMKDVKGDVKPKERLKEMTAALFYKCCALGYNLCGFGKEGLSDKELYFKNADGRDEGLRDIDENSPVEFEKWYNAKKRWGGHPWEVCRGGNSTHVDLYIHHDEGGYYFMAGGNHRRGEAADFYLAISRAGYPVGIYCGRGIADTFIGCDKIGIVPKGVFPRYCESYFPDENIIDFMNLYDDDKELLPYITWQKIKDVELA